MSYKVITANILNLCCYRILQSHGSQTLSLPISIGGFFSTCLNFRHTFSLSKTLPAPLVLLEGRLSWGFSPVKGVTQSHQVCFWDWHGHEKRTESRRLDLKWLPHDHPVPLPSRCISLSSSLVASNTKSQVGWVLGPAARRHLDPHYSQLVQWGLTGFSPVSLQHTAPRGLSQLKSVQSASVSCIFSGVLFLQCRVSRCGCLNAAVCCFLKAF